MAVDDRPSRGEERCNRTENEERQHESDRHGRQNDVDQPFDGAPYRRNSLRIHSRVRDWFGNFRHEKLSTQNIVVEKLNSKSTLIFYRSALIRQALSV